MKNYLACIFLFVVIAAAVIDGKTYYVSLTGSDANPGTFELPYLKIQTALNKVTAGDTIFIRGGIYKYNVKLSVAKLATESSRCYLLNYPGERVYLDFSAVPLGTRGIELKGNYWYLSGLDVYNAGDNGMLVSGKFNIVNNCAFYNNKDTGLQIGGGGSKNRIINCDSYFNIDTSEGNADGFAPKLDVGDSNYFYGCRAWQR
ncbi:MAG: right-handed parallel beta-helix repeat-containing protein [Ignavibacteriales bacterium]|nr:right-handed parallel beta-helix repeat-containing protein [Ignavibacteriales bacterium]